MDDMTKVTYEYLQKKYKRLIIGKKELIQEMNISMGTLDTRIDQKINLPKFRKDKSSKNAKNTTVTFHILDVAEYLNSNKIETM